MSVEMVHVRIKNLTDSDCDVKQTSDRTRTATRAKMPQRLTYEWAQGAEYELIPGRLYFSAHPNEDFTQEIIVKNHNNYYFSSDLPGTLSSAAGSPHPLPKSQPAQHWHRSRPCE